MSSDSHTPSVYSAGADHAKTTVAIITARWHADVIETMYLEACKTLQKHGITEENIERVVVPGSFEIPLAARWLIQKKDAVLCFGCVIQGETTHNEYINHSVCQSIQSLMLAVGKPIINGILTTQNMEQAQARANGMKGNKGHECAVATLEMIDLNKKVKAQERPTVGLRF